MSLSISALESWDFRVSLTGKVLGRVMALTGAAARDANGLDCVGVTANAQVESGAALQITRPMSIVARFAWAAATSGDNRIGVEWSTNGQTSPYYAYTITIQGTTLGFGGNIVATYFESPGCETISASSGTQIYIATFADVADEWECKLYKDGSQQSTTYYIADTAPKGPSYDATNNPIIIGGVAGGNAQIADMTHFALFGGILTAGDIAAIQASPDEIFPAGAFTPDEDYQPWTYAQSCWQR